MSRSEFQHKYGLTVNFLTYNGLLAAIPAVWKRSILNSERILTDVDRNDLSPANVTAKCARELLVLKVFKAPNVEIKLVEKHLLIKAIYELPFKVTLENKLRCFQYKLIHNILPTNSRLHKMKLKTSPSCDRCSSPYETLSHLLYECSTVQIFWQKVAWWNERRSESVTLNYTDILYGYKPESCSFL